MMHVESVMTPRLLTIAACVPENANVCDVGTDHGYIPIYLCQNNPFVHAMAMDLRPGPLGRAKDNIEKYGLGERISTRISDGLCELLPGEADTAVIAGMGGLLISEILTKAPFELDYYVLQPMTAVAELREYLAENGFVIVDEVLAREDEKIYTVISAKKGSMTVCDPIYYQAGEKLFEKKDPLLPEYLDKLLNKYKAVQQGLMQSERVDTKEKTEKLASLILALEQKRGACDRW